MDTNEQINLGANLDQILGRYSKSFSGKLFSEESTQEDDLMLVFGLTQVMKAENKQYWGRELGMCWQLLVRGICQQTRTDYGNAIKEGNDEICDFVIGKTAIDTKYRIGSGDSGTLKKFRQYAGRLRTLEYDPVLLILRTDNLISAINSCKKAGWTVYTGAQSYQYIYDKTGFDLKAWLVSRKNLFVPTQGTQALSTQE
jgi:hypothetical protein